MSAGRAELPSVAVRVSRRLTTAGIRHAVSGSIAASFHGYVRGTLDVDLLVVTPRIRYPEVFEVVRAEGFSGDDRALLREIDARFCAALTKGPMRFEVFVPALPFHRTLVDRAVERVVDGVHVPVVSAEDLIVLKMLWYRDKDAVDIARLLEANRGKLDLAYLRNALASIVPDDDARHAMLERLLIDHA